MGDVILFNEGMSSGDKLSGNYFEPSLESIELRLGGESTNMQIEILLL